MRSLRAFALVRAAEPAAPNETDFDDDFDNGPDDWERRRDEATARRRLDRKIAHRLGKGWSVAKVAGDVGVSAGKVRAVLNEIAVVKAWGKVPVPGWRDQGRRWFDAIQLSHAFGRAGGWLSNAMLNAVQRAEASKTQWHAGR